MTPLVIDRKVVATGAYSTIIDLCARLRARGIDASMVALCDACGQVRRSVRDYAKVAVCASCRRRLVRLDREREAERRGGAEPE